MIASDKALVVVDPDTTFPLLVCSLIAFGYSNLSEPADNPRVKLPAARATGSHFSSAGQAAILSNY